MENVMPLRNSHKNTPISHNIKTDDGEVNITNYLVAMTPVIGEIYYIKQQVNSQFFEVGMLEARKMN